MLNFLLPIAGALIGGLSAKKTKSSSTSDTTGTKVSTGRTLNKAAEDQLLAMLGPLLGGASGAMSNLSSTSSRGLANPIEFDREAFVQGITGRARTRINEDLESNLNSLFSGLGANAGGNSMAFLLADRTRRAAASEEAGIEQEATATGVGLEKDIKMAETAIASEAASGFASLLGTILSTLKGAEVTENSVLTEKGKTTGKESGVGWSGDMFGKLMSGVGNATY